jgi:hypothetical protein
LLEAPATVIKGNDEEEGMWFSGEARHLRADHCSLRRTLVSVKSYIF